MPCEKSLCKINQIRNHTVIGICPKAGKLKTVTGLGFTCSPFLMLLFRIPSGAIRIILCICTIGNDKNLNVFVQSASCPERIPLVAEILSGFLLAFTMSLDDFVITHFVKGAGFDTLSTKIYTEVKKGIKPEMYALSSLLFLAVLILLLLSNYRPKRRKKAD